MYCIREHLLALQILVLGVFSAMWRDGFHQPRGWALKLVNSRSRETPCIADGPRGRDLNHKPHLTAQINLEGGDVENTDPNKDFRLASASVHESGALLLESRFNHLLDCNLEAIASDTPTSNTLEVPEMLRYVVWTCA